MKPLARKLFPVCFYFFFRLFFRCKVGAIYYHNSLDKNTVQSSLPVLLLANHVSWWDGFLLHFLSKKAFPKREFKIVMGYGEWSKRKWMRYLGAIPINQKSPSHLMGFLKNLKKERIKNPNFCLGYFYQGQMAAPGESLGDPPRGSEVVVAQLYPVQIIPVAVFVDVRFLPKPQFYVRLGQSLSPEPHKFNISTFSEAVNELNHQTIQETTQAKNDPHILKSSGWEPLW